MQELLNLIATGEPHATDGGMRVLNEFVGTDLTEDQLLPVARNMLPQLLYILGAPDVSHHARIRWSGVDRAGRK